MSALILISSVNLNTFLIFPKTKFYYLEDGDTIIYLLRLFLELKPYMQYQMFQQLHT